MVPSIQFDPLLWPCCYRISVVARAVSSKGVGVRFLSLDRRRLWKPSVLASAASHEESNPYIEVEKDKDDLKLGTKDSEEAWKQVLDSFKEQALKMQSISQEAYESYYLVKMVLVLMVY
ncbi:hypothetical protein CJ030_MR4G023930 [Morella rubra]|uniref:Uncharacterized protein n=1 Tax=Morella rubra TaxID=262757 RepID=A0A6A1VWH2_9ROSI|nr:hypothetical protein CJ030_MR4G023930 [Morella rubra]